ncbi:hypothetical protein BS50DRAFT_409159 [Corynespora cassiicola Philippines]|uniref:Uncharacterized protein n=1 Tax=Corynespora cassiicola Philippines TaxID=1448308 RepID=A0A2T2NL65_CORCC|nr:hypothetical protein BS50DRAFT_409159 [Corynespora cassiicola Philippines]
MHFGPNADARAPLRCTKAQSTVNEREAEHASHEYFSAVVWPFGRASGYERCAFRCRSFLRHSRLPCRWTWALLGRFPGTRPSSLGPSLSRFPIRKRLDCGAAPFGSNPEIWFSLREACGFGTSRELKLAPQRRRRQRRRTRARGSGSPSKRTQIYPTVLCCEMLARDCLLMCTVPQWNPWFHYTYDLRSRSEPKQKASRRSVFGAISGNLL